MSTQGVAQIATECEEVMRFGHETVFAIRQRGVPLQELEQEFRVAIGTRYAWVNTENRERLLRQSLYYATKVATRGGSL